MDGIEGFFGWLGEVVGSVITQPLLHSLVVDGIIAGAGGVVVFLPQILILFFFILVLEESGYLPRAAFLLDKLMFQAGLSGRAFIPLLSSFACAVPGIMATRSISDPRDRFTTIMVAPLMTCSARLPVYALLIAAFIPENGLGYFQPTRTGAFRSVYGWDCECTVCFILNEIFPKDKSQHALLLELPSYRFPDLKVWESVC